VAAAAQVKRVVVYPDRATLTRAVKLSCGSHLIAASRVFRPPPIRRAPATWPAPPPWTIKLAPREQRSLDLTFRLDVPSEYR
jgi:hypothetical protein